MGDEGKEDEGTKDAREELKKLEEKQDKKK